MFRRVQAGCIGSPIQAGRSRGLLRRRRCGANGGLDSVEGGAVTRGCARRVKGRRTKQRQEAPRCKGGTAVRRHAGGLIGAGSYYNTLVKCVKPRVRNGKGVIGGNDHTQGPPINSGSLVIERTHINEKRAPKAPV
jgi:hypothetical protein